MMDLTYDELLDMPEIHKLILEGYEGAYEIGTDLTNFILHVSKKETHEFKKYIVYQGQKIPVIVIRDLKCEPFYPYCVACY